MTDTTADHAAKAQTEAAKKHADETRKKIKDERDAREKASKEGKAAGDVKPTPTQEECDLAASGVPVTEHEDDGSGPDPNSPEGKAAKEGKHGETRQMEANKAKPGYTTKAPA